MLGYILCLLILAIWLYRRLPRTLLDPSGKFVIVTGCDSGIGRELVHQLRKWKFSVVACCLTDRSCEELSKLDDVLTVKLDLRRQEDMKELKNVVASLIQKGKVFHGLVNNAAVMSYAKFLWMDPASIQNEININLCGTVLLAQHLLPLLRRSEGRLITISSPVALMPSPKLSMYCTTKTALETFNHCLRREVGDSLRVIIVRPCNLPEQTAILRGNAAILEKMKTHLDDEDRKEFEPEMDAYIETFRTAFPPEASLGPVQDRALFESLRLALLDEFPDVEYTAAPVFVKLVLWTSRILPAPIMDKLIQLDIPMRIIALARSQ